jgi:hypothetical protein
MLMNLDYGNLSGKLSMSKLLAIEPEGLRKLLKAGLRRGSSTKELNDLIALHFHWTPESEESKRLLAHLQQIGWLVLVEKRWKTQF